MTAGTEIKLFKSRVQKIVDICSFLCNDKERDMIEILSAVLGMVLAHNITEGRLPRNALSKTIGGLEHFTKKQIEKHTVVPMRRK